MCGIVGIYAPEASSKAQRALQLMAVRGREAAGIYDGVCTLVSSPEELPYSGSDHALGHVLHAMVGCVPQPLIGTGVLVANCEIYNWEQIKTSEGVSGENDAAVLLALLDKYYPDVQHVCSLLDGVYAFGYERDGMLTLARDILGVKPLFYADGFAFASERKALEALGYAPRELYPRTILQYNSEQKTVVETQRPFFTLPQPHSESYDAQEAQVATLLTQAVAKRVPDAPFGVLLSGGIDSGILTLLMRTYKPRCYVVGLADAPDVIAACELAKRIGVEIQVVTPTLAELQAALPVIVHTIEDGNPVKVSVAATMWFACAAAQRDGCRALFSGLGAEELFAGYERHRRSTDINRECLAGLRKLHERDLYRDDTITMYHGIELRLPFLDKALVQYSLGIPPTYKYDGAVDKKILRAAAEKLGLPHAFAFRPKKAAQYGSGMMKLLLRAAKEKKVLLADYLSGLRGIKNKRLASLLSGGKDSVLALHVMHRMAYDIACCITIESDNPDSYMFHTPNTHLAQLQADAMGFPLITVRTHGEKEAELDALKDAIARAKQQHGIEGVITGALASQYQRERIERVCDELSLTVFSPLWQMDQVEELQLMLSLPMSVILTRVAAEGLDASWLGKPIDKSVIQKLTALQRSHGVHPAGEGGEYESLVLDAPLFTKRLVLGDTEIIKDGIAATLHIKTVHTEPK
jgi:diphthine-ammonia ligase